MTPYPISRYARPFGWLERATFCVAIVIGSSAQPLTAQGTLVGQVQNTATKTYLQGARVEIQGTGRVEITDSEGFYRFTHVPPGPVTLVASYTGLKTEVIQLNVAATGPTRRDVGLTSDIYVMGQFVVSGEREGNALAITLQRHSDGVRNIVSADAFGNLAGNPADLLMRLPGISNESVGGDTRFIRIRGLHHNLASVSMDGDRIADAASAGATREVQWQQAGTEFIERVEVTKSPTPDVPADSIGGAVNIVSKSAFDRSPERRIGGSMGAVWRPSDDRSRPMRQWTFSYSEVFRDRFGVSFNYGHQPTESLIDGSQQAHQNVPNSSDGPAYTYQFFMRDQRNKRTRWGGGLRLDFKYSDTTRFFLNTIMNKHDEHANLREATFQTAQNVATVDANGNFTNNNHIIPGYTERVTEWRPLNNSLVRAESTGTQKIGKAFNYKAGGVHRWDTIDLDYDVYHSRSETTYPGNKTFGFIARRIGMRIERRDEPFRPILTQIAGPDITQMSSYTDNTYEIAASSGHDRYLGASLNLKKRWSEPVPSYIKTGFKIREQTRDLTETPWTGTYIGPDLAQFQYPGETNVIHDGRYPDIPYPTFPGRDTPGSARDQFAGFNIDMVFREHPELFERNTASNLQAMLTGDINFKETVSAAYIMGSVQLGRLNVLGGLRVEDTRVEGEGAKVQISEEERARRAAWGTAPLTDEEITRRTIAEFGQRERREGDYRGVFPSVHFKYQITPGLLARLSYASNIGRPNIGQIVPNSTVDDEDMTIRTSNPALKPQYADNFDLSMEYYFEPAGLLSAGVFLKEMKDFIFTQGGATVGSGSDNGFGGLYEGYTLTTQYNGGSSKVKGAEISYTQQFNFLPGFWKGFGAFANYTWLDAQGDLGAGNAITLGQMNAHTDEVPNFIPETGNLGVSYIRHKLSLRLQFNHVGRYLQSYNASRSRMQYRKARSTLDIKLNYHINRNLDFYLDVWNVLAEADRAIEFWGGRPQRMDKMRPQFFFGFRGRL
jgi:TonB-dependent receptor